MLSVSSGTTKLSCGTTKFAERSLDRTARRATPRGHRSRRNHEHGLSAGGRSLGVIGAPERIPTGVRSTTCSSSCSFPGHEYVTSATLADEQDGLGASGD